MHITIKEGCRFLSITWFGWWWFSHVAGALVSFFSAGYTGLHVRRVEVRDYFPYSILLHLLGWEVLGLSR